MMRNTWFSAGMVDVDCAEAAGTVISAPPSARDAATRKITRSRRRGQAMCPDKRAEFGIVPPCQTCQGPAATRFGAPDEPQGSETRPAELFVTLRRPMS